MGLFIFSFLQNKNDENPFVCTIFEFLMPISIYIFSLLYLLTFKPVDWGQTGHRVVGELAERYLSAKAKTAIDELLDGASLAEVSTYGDEIKSNPKYRKLNPWHYVNLSSDESYASAPKNPKGDVVIAIKKCISVIEDTNQPKNERAFYLKLLVHFVGDLHQPMHVGRKTDRGGNDIRIQWLKKTSNLHRLWDSHLIDSRSMSVLEWTNNIDQISSTEMKRITKVPIEKWISESHILAKIIYNSALPNSKLDQQYLDRYLPILELQLQRGGVRLASILNKIFR